MRMARKCFRNVDVTKPIVPKLEHSKDEPDAQSEEDRDLDDDSVEGADEAL